MESTEQKQLIKDVAWLKAIVQTTIGVNGPWMTPNQAAACLCVGATWLLEEIKLAEQLRAIQAKPHLKFGLHYRDDQSSKANQSTWKINVTAMQEFLSKPPSERKPSAEDLGRLESLPTAS